MPQLRQDRFTKEWVFVATESAEGPQDLPASRAHKRLPAFDPDCPVCPGNEHRTAPEVLRVPSPGKCGWTVRVVPNQFDIASIDGGPAATNYAPRKTGGFSIREVVVETPDHSLSTALLPEAQLARVWRASKIRYHELSLDSRIGHATILKNHGLDAGSSLEHPHSQIIATQMIPAQVSGWLREAKRHYGTHQECIFCRVLQEELEAQARIVTLTEHFVALEPFASPTPFCTHVYPRRHIANFGETSVDEINDLARILHGMLAKIYVGLDDPDFSYSIRTAPLAEAGANYYHWHLNIVPFLPPAVGIENAARILMNSVLPETAAEYLRSIRAAEEIPA
jgi:UDPglucose--hexose-1-phosphate uridylyltransferase